MAEISTVIFEELKREIATLAVKPGERIEEAEICDRYSVTRPVVRNAFSRLQDMGLLEIVPYKGATATLIDLSSVHQMIYLRTAVESHILRDFIALDPSPIVMEELEHNLRMQSLHIQPETVDEKEFFRLDSALHQFWFDRMHCGGIWQMIQNDINYERFRMLDFVRTLGYPDIVGSHEKLLDVIRKKNTADIEPVLSEHLNAGLVRMGNLIREEYRPYFILDEAENDYWVRSNQALAKDRNS